MTTEHDTSLQVRVGHGKGRLFRLKRVGDLCEVVRADGNHVDGVLRVWQRVAVLSGIERARYFVLEPAPEGEPQEIAFDGGYVRGRFTIVEKVNNPKRAREAFRAFEAT